MSLVRNAARAQVALLAALALGGCLGGDDSGAPASVQGAGVGVPLQLADCGDWNRADPRQRSHTIDGLKAFAGGPTGGSGRNGATLDDDRAYKLLDDYCRQDFARGFKLYKLYTRAAAFRKLAPE
jgi:hypothetical protein